MTALTIEARVVAGGLFGHIMTEVSFNRPRIIHPKTRKGLDELVEKGFLTVEKFNKHSEKLVWKITDKMRNERPKISMEFLEKHSFPVTTE